MEHRLNVVMGRDSTERSRSHDRQVCAGIALVLLLAGVAFVGCKKSSTNEAANANPSSAEPAEVTETTPQAAAPGPPQLPSSQAPAGTVIAPGANMDTILEQLTQSLRTYAMEHHAVPATFQEFVQAASVQAPEPPSGKMFSVDKSSLRVVLVER
jgi:hypothetical protein